MNLRGYDAAADGARLATFRCSSGAAYEDEVEQWIRADAIGWVNDLPRATFQRRVLGMIEQSGDLVAVIAWQDITRADLDGVWLEVLAVSLDISTVARVSPATSCWSTTFANSNEMGTTWQASCMSTTHAASIYSSRWGGRSCRRGVNTTLVMNA